ncbi:MAG: hypothetical protein D6720_06650 [Gammaproteobacteria bacterium]|nr:MAG: hypothetical protein D6720_06650 [Gammaproteobacteria bacterium]
MQTFDIYFRGELLPDADPALARAGIAKMFRLDEAGVERLFSGKPKRIKRGADVEKASRYRAAFREVGALIEIVPAGNPAPAGRKRLVAEPAQNATAEQNRPGVLDAAFELLPPRTGSLADCAPRIEPQPISDISWMVLDEPGVTLVEPEPQPRVEYDTSGLSMSPPRAFTLEDCDNRPPPAELPDISHLSLADSS